MYVCLTGDCYTKIRAQLFKNNDYIKVSLKFQLYISEICQYILLEKREKILKLLTFFSTKDMCVWLLSHKTKKLTS